MGTAPLTVAGGTGGHQLMLPWYPAVILNVPVLPSSPDTGFPALS
jgi:hypothetical protein